MKIILSFIIFRGYQNPQFPPKRKKRLTWEDNPPTRVFLGIKLQLFFPDRIAVLSHLLNFRNIPEDVPLERRNF